MTSSRPPSTSVLSEFVSYVLKRLPQMVITLAVGSFVHLYLIYLNNGFDAGKVSEWTPYINVDSNPGSSAFLIWTAVSALGWSFLYTLFKQGPVRAVTTIVMQPVNMVKKLVSSSTLEYACWALGGGSALIAAAALGSNRPAGMSMGLLWTILGMSRSGQAAAEFIFRGLTQVLTGHLVRMRPSVALIQIVIAAVGPGFLIAGVLGGGTWQALAGFAAVVTAAILLFMTISKGTSQPGKGAETAGQVSALFVISAVGAAGYALLYVLWPRSMFANDFGKAENGSFTNALKSGTDAVVTAVKNAVKGTLGATAGPLAPAVKPPRVYGPTDPETGKTTPERTNPWDPDPEEQKKKWEKDHVVWDPKTLSWRPPLPEEYPPPVNPPERQTPFQKQLPRDQVPPECLDLYDKYVHSQDVALNGANDLKAASDAYWEAQRRYNQLLAKWTLITGAEVGQIAAGGVEAVHGAGVAARSAGTAAVDASRAAAREGLRDIADRAAVEAAAADTEIASQGAMVTQLRQLSLDATAEMTTARQTLSTLKAAGSGVEEAQSAIDSASEELDTANKAAAEAEGEVVVARNRVDTAGKNLGRAKQVKALESDLEKFKAEMDQAGKETRDIYNKYKQTYDKELVARRNAKIEAMYRQQGELETQLQDLERQQRQVRAEVLPKADAELANLDQQIDALSAQRKQLMNRVSPNKTFKAGELSASDLEEYQRINQQLDGLQSRRLKLGDDPMAAAPEAGEKANALQAQIDAVKEKQANLAAKKTGTGFRDAAESEVVNEPPEMDSPELQAETAKYNEAKRVWEAKLEELDAKKAELERVENQVDPTYASQESYNTLENQLEAMKENAKKAKVAQDQAQAKVTEARQKLAQAKQDSAGLQEKIAQQEDKVKQLDGKLNDLASKESEAAKKLRDAEQKKAEALQKQQDALSSANKGGETGDPASTSVQGGLGPPITGPGSGRPMVDPRTGQVIPRDRNFDPLAGSVDRWKPDWAYWVEEKLHNGGEVIGEKLKQGFGVQSPDEIAQIMAEAKAALEGKFQALQDKMAAYGKATDDLGLNVERGSDYWDRVAQEAQKGLKAQLDNCITSHTYYTGKGDSGTSADQ